jgi:hypothetical protein
MEKDTRSLLGVLLEVSQNFLYLMAPSSCSLPRNVHLSSLGCGQGGKHKKMIRGLGWISGEVCEIPNVETHNARIDWLAEEWYAKIWND